MYTVHMAGIIYFHGCTTADKRALVPDGTVPEGGLPPHFTSLFVDPGQLVSADWWKGERYEHKVPVVDDTGQEVLVPVIEFRIPKPAEITFPDDLDDKAEFIDFEKKLPRLQTIDPAFVVDLDDVDTIAQVRIRGGKLDVYALGDAAVVRWVVSRHPDLFTIRARAVNQNNGDREFKTITLRSTRSGLGTEIVFANTPDLIGGHAHAHMTGQPHFPLFGKLDKQRDGSRLETPDPPKTLDALPTDHPYMRFLIANEEIGEPGCTPSCCS